MNGETLQKFKDILELKHHHITKRRVPGSRNLQIEREDLMDEVDMATADLEQGMALRMGNREILYLKKVQQAFHRIDEGTYGDCKSCGEQINVKRLEARPTAELCIMCKEESEKKENHSAEGRKPKSVGRTIRLVAN